MARLERRPNDWRSRLVWLQQVVMPNDVMRTLRLSYDALPSHLKPCFLYCSAFPKDSEIECERLIELWIGEGFICTGKNESPWDEGWTYLNELMDRCLIQLCERFMSKLCKMHDLLRDLCLRISQEENKCVFEVGKQLEQFPPSLEKSLRRISLISTDIRAIPETNQFSGLRTLLLSDCNRIGNIPASLLSNLKSLRVLDLSWTSIKSLPKAVGNLKLLRVLDVSHTDIEGLPESVRGLKSLQLLDATGCRRLQRLPEGISELKCMRHLDADYCDKLEHIPKGVGKITCLEILRGVYSRSENGLRLEDLGDLTRLRDLQLKIKHELDLKCLAEGILGGFVKMRRLRIKNCLHLDVSDSVFPRLSERMPSFIELETLILNGFAVPNWICSFQNLIMIRFYQLSRHRTLMNLFDKAPSVHKDVFVAPSAAIIGDVKVDQGSSIWYGCILRGDVNNITVGSGTNIQDNTLVHVAKTNISGNIMPTIIGSKVTIGHSAVLHGCTIEDEAFVGMGATLLDGAVVEKNAMVAAGALVRQNARIPSGEVWAGNPAKFLRKLTNEEIAFIAKSASNYANLAQMHASENAKSFDEIEAEKVLRKKLARQSDDYDSHMGIVREIPPEFVIPDNVLPDKAATRGSH